MENEIQSAVRVFGSYYDEEKHLPVLLKVASKVGLWDEVEFRAEIKQALADMLKGRNYRHDVKQALKKYSKRPAMGSVTELLIVLAWRNR